MKIDSKWVDTFLKQHEEDIDRKYGSFGRDTYAFHICPVLKMLMLRTFFYEILFDIGSENHLQMNEIRSILDRVLFTNQNIIRAFKKHSGSNAPVFPNYFEKIPIEVRSKCMEESELYIKSREIRIFSECDIRPYYVKILNILGRMNDLPEEEIFSRMVEHAEYGVYLGFLLSLETDTIEEDILYPNDNERKKLEQVQRNFRLGIEKRAVEIAKHFNAKLPEDSFIEL